MRGGQSRQKGSKQAPSDRKVAGVRGRGRVAEQGCRKKETGNMARSGRWREVRRGRSHGNKPSRGDRHGMMQGWARRLFYCPTQLLCEDVSHVLVYVLVMLDVFVVCSLEYVNVCVARCSSIGDLGNYITMHMLWWCWSTVPMSRTPRIVLSMGGSELLACPRWWVGWASGLHSSAAWVGV